MTVASVRASPFAFPPLVALPIEPGVLLPVMLLILTGELTSATASAGAGFTDFCSDGGDG